jgi:hypothetical protein
MKISIRLRRLAVEVVNSLRASPLFALAMLVTLGIVGLIGLMTFMMALQPGFMGMTHFSERHHRVYDLTFGFLVSTGLVGILTQLRRPSVNIAGVLMALIPWVGLLLAAVLSADARVMLSAESILIATLTGITALLHTSRGRCWPPPGG